MRHLPPTLIALLVSVASAQPPGTARLLKNFDFEERRLGNQEDLPMHWVKVHGPGLPHYVNGRLTRDRHRGGEYSFRFDLNGGSLIYRYEAGRIKAAPGEHYRIEGYCQTTVLSHARARISASIADAAGHALPQTECHSELYAAERESEPWKRLSVDLTADVATANSIVIQLELLQPMSYRADKPSDPALFDQDIYGSAWWDDISVWQVPQVALQTKLPGNLFHHADALRLNLLVSDRSVSDLNAQVAVFDADGHEQFNWEGTLDGGGIEKVGDGEFRLPLNLPSLSAGWYRAQAAVSSSGRRLAENELHLVVLPPDDRAEAQGDERFGLMATSVPFELWNALPQVLPLLPAGRVKLPVWSADGEVDESHAADFDRLLLALHRLHISPAACLCQPPPQLAAKLGGPGWAKLAEAPPSDWQPALALLIARHATQVNAWQVGPEGADGSIQTSAMSETSRRIYEEFSRLLDKPDLTIQWAAGHEPIADLPVSVGLTVPASLPPRELPAYVQDVRKHIASPTGSPLKPMTIFLPLDSSAQYGRQERARRLAQKVVYALAAGVDRIDLPLPLDVHRGADGATLQPDELYPVVRTILSALSGVRYEGRVAAPAGIDAFLFEGGGRKMLVIWGNADRFDVRALPLHLGERATKVDLWGNSTPLKRADVPLWAGPDPIFLLDIDAAQLVTTPRSLLDNSPAR